MASLMEIYYFSLISVNNFVILKQFKTTLNTEIILESYLPELERVVWERTRKQPSVIARTLF